MFPFPQLPTDHLYKLVTFIGLSMVIGSFVILFGTREPIERTGSGVYARMAIFIDRLKDEGLTAKPLPENISSEDVRGRYEEYRDLIRTLPPGSPKATELRDLNEQLLVARMQARDYREQSEFAEKHFYWLYFFGSGFLILGIWWWYRGFQRHQDEIMRISAIEAHMKLRSLTSPRDNPRNDEPC